LLFYFTSYVLDMFRTLIYPSSGACDCVVELPHRSSCSQFIVCWRFGAAGFGWCSSCRLKHNKWHQVGLSFFNGYTILIGILAVTFTHNFTRNSCVWFLSKPCRHL